MDHTQPLPATRCSHTQCASCNVHDTCGSVDLFVHLLYYKPLKLNCYLKYSTKGEGLIFIPLGCGEKPRGGVTPNSPTNRASSTPPPLNIFRSFLIHLPLRTIINFLQEFFLHPILPPTRLMPKIEISISSIRCLSNMIYT